MIVVRAKASGSPQVSVLWLGLSRAMLPVKIFAQRMLSIVMMNLNELLGLSGSSADLKNVIDIGVDEMLAFSLPGDGCSIKEHLLCPIASTPLSVQ